MAGAKGVQDVAVVLAALVGVADKQGDGRAGSLALEHAGEDFHLIGFLPLRDVAAGAGAAAVEIGLDVGKLAADMKVTANTPPPAPTASPGPPQGTTPAAAPTGAAPTNGESSASRTYELGREVSVANGTPGKIKRLSVAVALSATALKKAKPQDIEQMKQLVSAAVGADPARGDQVAVVLRPFDAPVVDTIPMWQQPWFQSYVRYGLALVGVLLVLLLGVRPLIKALKRDPAPAAARDDEDKAETGEGAEGEGQAAAQALPPPVTPEHLVEQVSLAQRIAAERPDDAVLALREMLNHNPEPEPAA